MLSRSSTAVRKAPTAFTVSTNFRRANSTDSAEPPQPSQPKRSIPRASAFADLLASTKNVASNRRGAIGLSSLGDDQFDGLARLSSSLNARKSGEIKGLTQPPSSMRVAGLTLNFKPPTSGDSQEPPLSKFTHQPRNLDAGKRDEQSRKSFQGFNSGRRAQETKPTGRQRTMTGDLARILASHPPAAGRQDASQKLKPPAPPLQKRKRPIQTTQNQPSPPTPSGTQSVSPQKLASVQSTDIKALFKAAADPAERVVATSCPAQLSTLVSTRSQHYLEHYAGDYSRYLPEELSRGLSVHATSPVSYAKLHLARSWDVSLKQRRNAVNIVKKVAGTAMQNANIGA